MPRCAILPLQALLLDQLVPDRIADLLDFLGTQRASRLALPRLHLACTMLW